MFTGIIRNVGTITKIDRSPDSMFLSISSPNKTIPTEGSSLAVNGACLTVLPSVGEAINFRLMKETLDKTNLGKLKIDDRVNLEHPLVIGDALDGHFVLGHVDGIAVTKNIEKVGGDLIFTFQPPANLMSNLIPKGSIALDGVSLTIVSVLKETFTVSVMPYTLEHTTFGSIEVGYESNIEIDMIAKHVERQIQALSAT